eukprot:3810754-Pleurochrysis_carterae.AAC.3
MQTGKGNLSLHAYREVLMRSDYARFINAEVIVLVLVTACKTGRAIFKSPKLVLARADATSTYRRAGRDAALREGARGSPLHARWPCPTTEPARPTSAEACRQSAKEELEALINTAES